jgi:hypothetical protein
MRRRHRAPGAMRRSTVVPRRSGEGSAKATFTTRHTGVGRAARDPGA